MADLCNMSRKTRTRQTRIHAALQSGYCAICHIPYNSLDDHIQSKKHLKLIGEDANYISINGFIDQNSLDPFLNLNGIESIDINGRHIEKEYSTRSTRNSKSRGPSLERLGPSPIDSPVHHHLRSRKQINYAMSPSLDDDSLSEKTELIFKAPVKEKKEKNISCKNIEANLRKAQDVSDYSTTNSEVWNSGRPKRRSCIRSKRTSADERLVVDNKTYYKVEVMSTKLRSSSTTKEYQEVKQNNESLEKDDKGLIVKFKKLRHSELTLLNNEAENFLFPKKDDSSSSSDEEDEADIDGDGANTTVSSCGGQHDSFLPSSDTEEYKAKDSFKVEDEGSMDSTTSSGKRKKKRRTHAEAFIMDNQKYYKFETPGSRLRYHGSYFSELDLKSQKHNGEVGAKEEKLEITESEEEKCKGLNLENYQFAFEMVPSGEKWYSSFRRQDLGEESYMYLPDEGCGNRFILPYQIGHSIPSLDPKVCISQYEQLKKMIQEASTASDSRTSCSTPEPSEHNYTASLDIELMDEDSKSSEPSNSIEFCSENSNSEDGKIMEIKKIFKRGRMPISKNPRKSPRQHASTLAILSSLIQQRKRRSKSGEPSSSTSTTAQKFNTLAPIPEDVPTKTPRANYDEILHSINQDWDVQKLTEDIDLKPEGSVEFSNKLGILDVLGIYDRLQMKDDFRSNRKFINGSPGRKPGRRKMNKTGWPNRKKSLIRKDQSMKEESSSHGSVNDSEEEPNMTDSIRNVDKVVSNEIVNENCDLNRVQVKENVKNVTPLKVKLSSVKRNITMQPIVKVRKLDAESVVTKDTSVILSPKRTNKRRMPASPKSPRMLRRPRGKWYKER